MFRLLAVPVLLLLAQDGALDRARRFEDYEERRGAIGRRIGEAALADGAEAALALRNELEADAEAPSWYVSEVAALQRRIRALLALAPDGRERAVAALSGGSETRKEAVATFEELLGPADEEVAWRLYALHGTLFPAQRYGEALEAIRGAQEIVATLPEDRAATIALHGMWVGETLLQLRRLAEAEVELRAARETWERLGCAELGLYEEDALHTAGALSRALEGLGRFEESEAFHREFLLGTRRFYGPESRQYAAATNNMAVHLFDRGEVARAVPVFRENLAKKLRLLGPDDPSVGVAWLNLGIALTDLGDDEAALEPFDEAWNIFRRHGAAAALASLMTLERLAALSLRMGDLDSAERYAQAALEAVDEVYADHLARRASLLATCGRVLLALGDLDRAEELLSESLAIRLEQFDDDHLVVAESKLRLGHLYEERRDLDRAEALFEEALRIAERSIDPGSSFAQRAHGGLGRVHYLRGELGEAEASYTRAAGIFERGRSLRTGRYRSEYIESPYSRLAVLRAQTGDALGAWEAFERWRSRSLFELVATADPAGEAGGEELAGLREEAVREEQLVRALEARADEADPEHARSLLEARARLGTIQAQIARADAREALEPLPLERIRDQLASDEAVLGWIQGKDPAGSSVLFSWCLRAEEPVRWFSRPSDDGFLGRLQAFRDMLRTEARSPFPAAPEGAEESARAIHRRLFGELEAAAQLDGVEHLVLVSSDHVEVFPFAALIDEEGRSLGERFTLSVVPSASLHTWLRERPRRAGAGASVLAVGDPRFTDMTALPASRAEVEAVTRLFPERRALLGDEATETALGELAAAGALASFGTLHFATHALVDHARPDRSAIVLSGNDRVDPLEAAILGVPPVDGLLSAGEILARFRLDAELVTLSACRTASGKPTSTEGHLGLTTAFLQVGARSVLGSLWETNDEATTLFMQGFYRHWRRDDDLGPRTKAEALRRARRDLRAYSPDGESRPYAHPAFWAGFVLTGDPY